MTARCCCGACSIEVEGAPLFNAICHCGNCKRRTGSAFGWSTYFADRQVLARTGDLRCYEIVGTKAQQRFFCAACGTTLFWKIASRPGHTGIAGGCFADPPPPTDSVANSGRFDWLCTIVQDGGG
jgi:hypothetical protein